MPDVPEIRFARAAGSSIAYEVYGDGPVTVCAVPPMAQNIELAWDSPVLRRMFERFGAFSRQIAFDKRGTGMSDRNLAIPALDERVDELTAVMDAAGVDRAFLHGISEGGPMAIMFAATYPERVEGLILEGTAAALTSDDERAKLADPDFAERTRMMNQGFIDAWGTSDSMTLSIFGPSLLENEEFAAWWPRYERQAANRDALLELFRMNAEMDARDVVGRVDCPVLILHRTGDRVIPVERARDTFQLFDEAGADVRMIELPGIDHFTFAGDVDSMVDEIERFTTGAVRERQPRRAHQVTIRAMGRFEVEVDGELVPTSAWGSKRARTLLKRLVAARGWPVPRDELIEILWPDELSDRLGARLSVQLSAVRRILFGSVNADRSTIRLDATEVTVDVDEWFALERDDDIVDRYTGEFLPEDRYDDWTAPLREEMRTRCIAAGMAVIADQATDLSRRADVARKVLAADRFHEPAHRALIISLAGAGSHGAASTAYDDYVEALGELDIEPEALAALIDS